MNTTGQIEDEHYPWRLHYFSIIMFFIVIFVTVKIVKIITYVSYERPNYELKLVATYMILYFLNWLQREEI